MQAIPFLRARYFTNASRRSLDLVVIHDMEYPERMDAAEQVARWFSGSTSPRASAHYCIDNNSIVQCVLEEDVAWHAPGANHNSIGLEHAGYAKQRPEDWADAYSSEMLKISARLTGDICKRWRIPVQFCDANMVRAGARGITTHHVISQAFRKSDHWDPGPNFPMAHYLAMVSGVAPTKEAGPLQVNAPVVAILSHPDWNGGYIEVGADGGTFSWGGAPNFGSTGNVKLNAPVVGGAVTASGRGYWLVARDGGIFNFGDAEHRGNVLYPGG